MYDHHLSPSMVKEMEDLFMEGCKAELALNQHKSTSKIETSDKAMEKVSSSDIQKING